MALLKNGGMGLSFPRHAAIDRRMMAESYLTRSET